MPGRATCHALRVAVVAVQREGLRTAFRAPVTSGAPGMGTGTEPCSPRADPRIPPRDGTRASLPPNRTGVVALGRTAVRACRPEAPVTFALPVTTKPHPPHSPSLSPRQTRPQVRQVRRPILQALACGVGIRFCTSRPVSPSAHARRKSPCHTLTPRPSNVRLGNCGAPPTTCSRSGWY
jgi:hypothetical protein